MPEADRAALPRQHHARDAAHPGAGRPHDGADRAGVAARARARPSRWRCAPLLEELAASAQAAGAPRAACACVLDAAAATRDVEGDAFLLRRAVSNLLDNAIDFSPAGGAVHAGAGRAGAARVDVTRARPGPGHPRLRRRTRCSRSSIRWRGRTRSKQEHRAGPGLRARDRRAAPAAASTLAQRADGGGALATLSLPLRSAPR